MKIYQGSRDHLKPLPIFSTMTQMLKILSLLLLQLWPSVLDRLLPILKMQRTKFDDKDMVLSLKPPQVKICNIKMPTRPSALGMSDPGVDPVEILEILELEALPYPCPLCRLVR